MIEKYGDEHLPHADVTREIIGVVIDVHKAIGPGFKEAIYHAAVVQALCRRCGVKGIPR